MRYALPQPYEDLAHTADAGVVVRGTTPEQALARLVLALATLLSGGGPVAPVGEETLLVSGGADLAQTAVATLREVLFRFATRRTLPCSCEVRSLSPGSAELSLGFGRHDPILHAEGVDVKAVTYHGARFEPEGAGWRAQVIFDI